MKLKCVDCFSFDADLSLFASSLHSGRSLLWSFVVFRECEFDFSNACGD